MKSKNRICVFAYSAVVNACILAGFLLVAAHAYELPEDIPSEPGVARPSVQAVVVMPSRFQEYWNKLIAAQVILVPVGPDGQVRVTMSKALAQDWKIAQLIVHPYPNFREKGLWLASGDPEDKDEKREGTKSYGHLGGMKAGQPCLMSVLLMRRDGKRLTRELVHQARQVIMYEYGLSIELRDLENGEE